VSDNPRTPPVERAIELMVYAPIGFAMFAKDMMPPLVDQFVVRGRARLTELQQQVENQLGQARIMGQFAVAQGRQQVRQGVEGRLHEVREQGEKLARTVGLVAEPPEAPARHAAATPAAAGSSNGASAPRGDASGLPIPDYDELSASQVVARLAGLEGEDLEAVREYEASQRQRKTILTKIDQLTA